MTEERVKYFSEYFSIISRKDAKQLWNVGDRSFLVLFPDGTDRYAENFNTWAEIERLTCNDVLFGIEHNS